MLFISHQINTLVYLAWHCDEKLNYFSPQTPYIWCLYNYIYNISLDLDQVRCQGETSFGICIHKSQACNGYDDCGDNAEENEAWCAGIPCNGMC